MAKHAFAALLITAALIALARHRPGGQTLGQVPALTLTTLDGRTVELARRDGRPLLLVFWSTTCGICIEEIPTLTALYRDFESSGFEVLGVAMYYDRPDHVVELVRSRRVPYPVALDLDGKAQHGFGGITATPSTFLIDGAGNIVTERFGALDVEEIRGAIRATLPHNRNSHKKTSIGGADRYTDPLY